MAEHPYLTFRQLEILQLFAEAQEGHKTGAQPIEHTEGMVVGRNIDLSVAVSKGSAILGANMKRAGYFPPGDNFHAHHIVPQGMAGASRAREILRKADIYIDSATNGVWLPGRFSTVNVDGNLVHQGMHSPEYLREITRILAGEMSHRGEVGVRSALVRLRHRIQNADASVAGPRKR
jgi:hypothetical protein